MKFSLCCLPLTTFLLFGCTWQNPQLGKDPIEKIVAEMTLEEKADFVVGTERRIVTPPEAAPGMPKREREPNAPASAVTPVESKVVGAAGQHYAIPRLGIEPIVYADGPAGVRIDPIRKAGGEFYCTAFPIGATLASSWDVDLVKRVTEAIGGEALQYGVDILLAPAINIHRSPLCGRNFEYFSEDPLLSGKIGAAYIQGVQSQGVGAALKHFAVNNQETCRNGVDVRVSERALREIYLKGFEIAVEEGQPWTVMSSYNKVNGTLASENPYLLTDILRGEWDFQGFVMTDWWAEENGARQIAAGNDLLMPGTVRQREDIIKGIQDGTLTEADLDLSVSRIMQVMLKTPTYHHYPYNNMPNLSANAALCRTAAAEGMVLLRNVKNVLPLKRKPRVALFGTASYDLLVGGSGSGNVNRKYKVSLDEGLTNAGLTVEPTLAAMYRDHVKAMLASKPKENFWTVPVVPDVVLDKAQIKAAVSASDITIMTLSRMAGEGADRKLEKGDYLLTDQEIQNIRWVIRESRSQGHKFILVLNMGNIVDLTPIEIFPDAILQAWMGGQEMGNAVADILTGKVNPSGRLPMTWAYDYNDYPSAANFPCTNGNAARVDYKEDVLVGYRHFITNDIKPLFPFGYGLSYTTFTYEGLSVKEDGEDYVATVRVKNTGSMAGKEVVQLYVSKPSVAGIIVPDKELLAFAKTSLLEPGKSEVITMKWNRCDMAVWEQQGWSLTPGIYEFSIGLMPKDVRLKTSIELL